MALGQAIREARKAQRLSATVTAEAAGISRVTLYRIEKGEPSVVMGAYLQVALALGLTLTLDQPQTKRAQRKLPAKIRISDYKQLKRLAWQLKDGQEMTPEQALSLYERNWRHVDEEKMDERERDFLKALLAHFGRERLLV